MPSPFGIGLASGVVEGWTKQSEQQDQLKRQQTQQQIENNLHIINAQDVPDDVKQNAAQNLQVLMQGKKPGGKNSGPLSPVMDRLLKLIGKSHGAPGGKNGGMTENLPNGQPAPGTAGSVPAGQPSPLNTDPRTGRPTLKGTGNAASDPSNAPQPQPGQPAQQPGQPQPQQGNQSTLDGQIETTQRALEGTQNPITKAKLTDRLNSLNDLKIKQEQAESLEDKRETGREAIEREKTKAASEKSEMEARHKKELQDAALDGKKAIEEAEARHKKELAELTEKNREALKKTLAAGKGVGAAETKARTARFQKIEDEKNKALQAAEVRFATSKAKADQLPPGQARGAALRDAMDALNTAKANAQSAYTNAIKQAAKDGGQSDDRVTVISPDGKKGTIPRTQLDQAKSEGYKEAA